MRKLALSDAEIVVLSALVILDPGLLAHLSGLSYIVLLIVIPSQSTREKMDVSTQTYSSTSPALPSDLGEIHDEMPACTQPTRPAPVHPTGEIYSTQRKK
ncbi:unnamed protein product [Angiostrongylus costaricensis]|uniref:NR LBD domain-containing protein n=1 Tax=Angiostrongylus costaricensis TaxID=334426 RepID=A0A0R3PIT5_ANGCS|nr:unnamed protein product [Angiostrongylus costaricensis]